MKKTIVITDDAAFMRGLLRNIIEQSDDYEVVGEASNGLEAVEIAKN